jgi:hypothetical protein
VRAALQTGRTKAFDKRIVFETLLHRMRNRFSTRRFDVESCITANFGQRGILRRDHRATAAHRFEYW